MNTAAALQAARRPLSREARIGVTVVGVVFVTRLVLGSFLVNDWEGWATFLAFAVAALVEALVLGALAFGLVVRLAARSRVARRAVGSLVVGVLAALSLAIPYSAPQAVLGSAAVAIGLSARERARYTRTRQTAGIGIGLGLVAIAGWLCFLGITVVTDEWPRLL